MSKKKEKEPLRCRMFGHNWQREKGLDTLRKQACKCTRCGKVIYLTV